VQTYLELRETAVPANVRRIRHRVAEAATDAGASSTVADEVALCVGEAVANVARHAYDHSFGSVGVLVQTDRDVLTVIVRDQGRGLVDGSETDGFGLRIIETLARDLAISWLPNRGTELRMQFPLDAPQRRRVA
jgi:anti-sigma regulatory factor (Ser/Thr protein kinase)